ncbi:MAG TPA: hypothetical protein VFQ39_03545 [Longimicrobium sp.]|nr:hypothetical protein [Longimicrobium sp.]
MSPVTLDAQALDRVRADLESLEGIRRAVVDGPPYTVYLICDRTDAAPTELYVGSVLARHGLQSGQVDVQLAYLPAPEPRRRIRFLSARLDQPRTGRARAEVELEWAGRTYAADLEGEGGTALELRLAALATLRTLDAILGGRVQFNLVGIKGFRAFDADLVVALVKSDVDGKSLIGAALATEDPYRSAALAVLNATNRILGNYLTNADVGS